MTVVMRGVTVRYGSVTALAGFSARFGAGRVTALTGGDGAGKSTLLALLAGRRRPESGVCTGLPGSERIGYEPSDSGTWANLSVEENLRFVARVYRMTGGRGERRIDRLLERAGLRGARGRLSRDLSGGMRQKLGFIMAALHEPDLLLLDEPTTGVDPDSRRALWGMIEAEAARGCTIVLSTTYIEEAGRAGQMILMDRGRAVAVGTAGTVIASVPGVLCRTGVKSARPGVRGQIADWHLWRRAAELYAWREDEGSVPKGFHRCAPDLENACIVLLLHGSQRDVPIPTGAGSGHAASGIPGAQLVRASGVSKRFGAVRVLRGVSISVHAGEIVGLIGGNGAGKTTLMRVLLGLERADEGTSLLFGARPSLAARRRIGYVPQGLGLYPTLTAGENLRFAARVYGCRPTFSADEVIRRWGSQPIGVMPLGARRRLAYAVASQHDPQLLILDEPTSGMDPVARASLWNELHRQADRGVGVLITTHYMSEAAQCDRCVMLENGLVR